MARSVGFINWHPQTDLGAHTREVALLGFLSSLGGLLTTAKGPDLVPFLHELQQQALLHDEALAHEFEAPIQAVFARLCFEHKHIEKGREHVLPGARSGVGGGPLGGDESILQEPTEIGFKDLLSGDFG